MFKKNTAFLVLSSLLLLPVLVMAQSGTCPTTSGPNQIPNPLRYCEIVTIIDSILSYMSWLAVVLAPLLVLVGAFYIMSAGGDAKRLTTGKNFIIWAAVGFVLVIGARGVMGLIKAAIGIQ